jgi:hypothetical protein
MYTDSKYAFTTIHVHGVLYKKRGLIYLGGKSVKYGQKFSKSWMLYGPLNGGSYTLQRAPKGDATIIQGNQKADRETKQAAPM